MSERLLEVDGLSVEFAPDGRPVRAVDGVSFTLDAGEVLAIVGESGSGKSAAVTTLMGLTRAGGARVGGQAVLRGELELLAASEAELRRVRGAEIAIVFQDPMTSFNPVKRIGDQIAEQIRAHDDVSRAAARERVVELLARVGIDDAAARARSFPHELSGGMRQRAMIAMALSCGPSVLIADEPTTALDVTTQAQVLAELDALRAHSGVGLILVTHDLGVVAGIADRVAVMYAGRIVEEGTAEQVFCDPQHPYTWGLLGSIPRLDGPREARLRAIPGVPPSLADLPRGCHFRPRCVHEFERCPEVPPLEARVTDAGHRDRCWLAPEAKRERRGEGGA